MTSPLARTARSPRFYRPHRGRIGCAAASAIVLLVGAMVLVAWLVRATEQVDASDTCTTQVDGAGWDLSVEQADNAALISAISVQRGLPARAATIGLATALQESRLVNIDYGDRDSVGLFQQRPSQGWGTVEEIMDPVYSTTRFYDALAKVDGYTEMEITEAAQAVQRSAFPDAYAQHEPRARAWASALTGWSEAALNCNLSAPATAGSVEVLSDRVQRDYGGAVTTAVDATGEGDRVVLTTDDLVFVSGGEANRVAWAVAQWAVAVAAEQHVVTVQVGGSVWDREAGGWAEGVAEEALPAGTVAVTLARG